MPLLQHPGGDLGMPDRSQEDGVAAVQVADGGVGEGLAGSQVSFTAQVERPQTKSKTLEPADNGEHFEALGNHFRANPIASEDAERDQRTLQDKGIPFGRRNRMSSLSPSRPEIVSRML